MRDLSWRLRKLVYEFVFRFRQVLAAESLEEGQEQGQRPPVAVRGDQVTLTGRSFHEIERAILAWALQTNDWTARRAARALGISRSTFHDRAVRYRLIVRLHDRSTPAARRKRRRG